MIIIRFPFVSSVPVIFFLLFFLLLESFSLFPPPSHLSPSFHSTASLLYLQSVHIKQLRFLVSSVSGPPSTPGRRRRESSPHWPKPMVLSCPFQCSTNQITACTSAMLTTALGRAEGATHFRCKVRGETLRRSGIYVETGIFYVSSSCFLFLFLLLFVVALLVRPSFFSSDFLFSFCFVFLIQPCNHNHQTAFAHCCASFPWLLMCCVCSMRWSVCVFYFYYYYCALLAYCSSPCNTYSST